MKLNRNISDKNNPTAVEVLSAVAKSYCGLEFRFSNIKNTMFKFTDSVSPVSRKAVNEVTSQKSEVRTCFCHGN